ncbi:MAG: hypothetical protein HN833_03650 [Elusimicrobiaceae bacterium]|jgi:hypothetical protein|nr:hypothetical protein [Elusimicrobiaceae bacterium]MBT3955490.1 hypothetical protein [Elusimicrobiaceae bacterium]MBT4008554.1 hypothetical protein [Elusimicrobiaceae bacterium]MBT4402373.1 hypothetical protein [Elusimicrobiaceae bacterium]MBT4440057.1 hypothetical protein [Elusimicrobiaceae bacterium]
MEKLENAKKFFELIGRSHGSYQSMISNIRDYVKMSIIDKYATTITKKEAETNIHTDRRIATDIDILMADISDEKVIQNYIAMIKRREEQKKQGDLNSDEKQLLMDLSDILTRIRAIRNHLSHCFFDFNYGEKIISESYKLTKKHNLKKNLVVDLEHLQRYINLSSNIIKFTEYDYDGHFYKLNSRFLTKMKKDFEELEKNINTNFWDGKIYTLNKKIKEPIIKN